MSGIDLPKLGFGTAAIALVAHSDAMATGQLIGKLLKELKLKGLRFNTFRDFWAWQRAEAMRQETSLRHYFIGKGKDADNQVWTWTDM